MWGRIRRRVTLWSYLIFLDVWFWVIVIKSIAAGGLSLPEVSQTGLVALVAYTNLFLISVWEIIEEED